MIRTILWMISSAYFFAVGIAFLLMASEAKAENTTPQDIQLLVAEKARQSGTGVILAISHRGPQAAETAYLLAVQSSNNPNYAPLLLIPEDQPLQQEFAALNLTTDQLPALIFFSVDAKEIGRFVSSNNAPDILSNHPDSSRVRKSLSHSPSPESTSIF